jgi:cell division septum initiation protein DivIVA
VPIKPEEIDPSELKVSFRGYHRKATNHLLERIALDYRQAVRAPEAFARESAWLKSRIAELEEQAGATEAEVTRLRSIVNDHAERQALVEAMLLTAQRTAQEIHETAQREAKEIVKAARQQAVDIEQEARLSIRQTAAELDRLRSLESDLRTRLRQTLEAALGDQ